VDNMLTGRVIEVQRVHISVALPDKVVLATVRGEFHETGEYPKVGDWVNVSLIDEEQAVIEELLPRSSVIERLDQETLQPQVLVANVDIVFIVMGLDGDYNVSRLERYLLLARQSNITPVVILNKSDLAPELARQVAGVEQVVGETPVHITNASTGDGLEVMRSYFEADTTAVLLGSSGAGKSTITNWLLGEAAQAVNEVRADDSRGRHTTTTRQLFTLAGGGYLIDTPGMRELSVVESESTQEEMLIEEIESLAQQCQFSNCDHEKSAGCAVLAAVDSGELDPRTLDNYYKLVRERAWQQDKTGSKERYSKQNEKRQSQAYAAAKKRRLMRGG
jgi:ribosome biogenesis GTPase